MKLNYALFISGIILITIGLWDYFYLRNLTDISSSEEEQQLVPSIVGAVLLVFSPLFEKAVQKWPTAVVCLFLVLTTGIFLSPIFTKPYVDTSFIVRHVVGVFTILLLIVTLLRNAKSSLKLP